MHTIRVQAVFSAAHALSIAGTHEPLHGHDWKVTAEISGETLDADGLLCDFHTVEETLGEIIAPFRSANLNDLPPFAGAGGLNPSAEHVAMHIARELASRLDAALAPHAKVRSVAVTEAPGCEAVFSL